MKRIIITIVFILISSGAFSQNVFRYKYSSYIDGYWSEWSDEYFKCLHINNFGTVLTIFGEHEHPSEYSCKITITNFYIPSKKDMRKIKKSGKFLEYSGYVEYYPWEWDKLRTDKDRARDFVNRGLTKVRNESNKLRKVRATISIQPFDNYPRVWNVFFDGVGFAINLKN
ncbi:MAG: hypothetical protein J6L20_07405 [Bacteroidales bacterium]|nr:hypothetical protein [Bacteroidales bacterium]